MNYTIRVEITTDSDYTHLIDALQSETVTDAAYNLAHAIATRSQIDGYRRVRILNIDGNRILAEAFRNQNS